MINLWFLSRTWRTDNELNTVAVTLNRQREISMADDILQEVPKSEIPKVLEEMKKDWPKHFLLHQYISMMEDKKNCKTKLHQVLYRCGTPEHVLYVVCTEIPLGQKTKSNCFVYTKSENLSGFENVMMKAARILCDYKDIMFEMTLDKFTPTIMKGTGNLEKKYDVNHCISMYFPPEGALHDKELPEAVYLDYLNDNHVPEVDKNWTYTGPGTDEYLGSQIKNNFGLGLFQKSDKMLLSSAISYHNGAISVLFTDPRFRSKGYAEIIVWNMIKEIRQKDRIPFCAITLENTPSQKLFTKIGFKEFAPVDYIFESH